PLEEGMTTCSSCGSKIEILSKEEADQFANKSSNMVYCSRCGKPITSDAVMCIHCGCAVGGQRGKSSSGSDGDSVAWGFIGFFMGLFFTPIIGLILWLVWRVDKPERAKGVGIGTLISLIIGVVAVVAFLIWYFALIGSFVSGATGAVAPILGAIGLLA
ncbi:MAG: hypothetical protein J6Q06_03035, partial [Clostridia bacterium]|nr:hypothetical protein [Clostridia bacterium]